MWRGGDVVPAINIPLYKYNFDKNDDKSEVWKRKDWNFSVWKREKKFMRRRERGKKFFLFSCTPIHDLWQKKIYYKYCAFPWSPLFWKPNLFAIWLRSSVVSVLFSVTAEMSSLMTWNCYNIEFLEIGELVLNGLAHNQLAQCRCLHWLLTRKTHHSTYF